jgi:1-acyl-sn-glycerol-3-phosphate acyltransferase
MAGWLGRLWYDWNYSLAAAGLVAGFSFRWEGARHVPATGPALLLANHQSFLDPMLVGIAASTRRLRFLARKSLFRGRLFGALISSLGAVPVDQDGVATEGLKAVLALLDRGEAVLIFPEGNRTEDGLMQPFQAGVTLLLRRSPVPVVPVGVAGAYQALPKTASVPRLCPLFLPSTGAGVGVSIGAPLPPKSYAGLGRAEVLRLLQEAVSACQRRAEALRRK